VGFAVPTAATLTLGIVLGLLTPLNSGLFPWLSGQATYWTKFYFRKVRAVFVTNRLTSSGSENITVFMVYTPDVYLDSGISLDTIMGMSQKQMAVQWQSFNFAVDLAEEGSEPFYLDSDGVDSRLEIQGILGYGQSGHIGAAGGDTTTYGQLFIEYEVDLYDRKLTAFTMLAEKYRRALSSRNIPEELRRRAGFAFVEEVIRASPTRLAREPQAAVLLRELEQLRPTGLSTRSSSLVPAATGITPYQGGL
jgi:hypothetical protein